MQYITQIFMGYWDELGRGKLVNCRNRKKNRNEIDSKLYVSF